MSQPDQGLDISQAGDVTVVSFRNTTIMDAGALYAIGGRLTTLADESAGPKIVVDFSGVRFIASRLLGSLVDVSNRAQARGGKVVLCGLHRDLYKVFTVSRLDRLLTFAPDRAAALDALGAEKS